MARIVSVVVSLTLFGSPALARPPRSVLRQAQTAQSTATVQPSHLLQQSLAALVGNTSLSDVTLSGTARRIAGSDDETGSVNFQAVSSAFKISLNLPSGTRSETHTVSNSIPSGTWTGPDGAAHSIAQHNLIADDAVFPTFTLSSILSNPNSIVTLVGQETRNGQAVIHFAASQQFPTLTGDTAALMQHLSQLDIFLDLSTSLPVSIAFNTHADDNALLDIPVEIQFSEYRIVSGVQIPFHIQKFLNNSLLLDLQFQSASINSGLSAAQVGAL